MLRQSSADNNVPPRAPQLTKRAVTPTRGLSLQPRTKLGQHNVRSIRSLMLSTLPYIFSLQRSAPFGLGLNTSSSRTPGKKNFGSNSFLAFGAKTPSKTPSKKSPAKKSGRSTLRFVVIVGNSLDIAEAALTPSRNCNIDTLAISANFGDRFIAQRNDSQFELGELRYLIEIFPLLQSNTCSVHIISAATCRVVEQNQRPRRRRRKMKSTRR